MTIEERINTRERIAVMLRQDGNRAVAELVIYKPYTPNQAAVRFAVHLHGKPFTAYIDEDRMLRFGRLYVPLYKAQPSPFAGWLAVCVGFYDAGRMLAYCRSRRWTWLGGVDSLAQAWAGDAAASRLGDILKNIFKSAGEMK